MAKTKTKQKRKRKEITNRNRDEVALVNPAHKFIVFDSLGKIAKVKSPKVTDYEMPESINISVIYKDWEKQFFVLWFQGRTLDECAIILNYSKSAISKFAITDTFKNEAKKLIDAYFHCKDRGTTPAARDDYTLTAFQNQIVFNKIKGYDNITISSILNVKIESIELELQQEIVKKSLENRLKLIADERRQVGYPALLTMALDEAKKRLTNSDFSNKDLVDLVKLLSEISGDKEKAIDIGMIVGEVVVNNTQNNIRMPDLED